MNGVRRPTRAPVIAALFGGTVAVCIGAAVMLADGGVQAAIYAVVNGAGMLAGVVMAGLLLATTARAGHWLAVAAALALLTTALIGTESEGIRRWVAVPGGIHLQPAFIVLPLLLCSYARNPGERFQAVAIIIAAVGVAAMPDLWMALPIALVGFAMWVADRTSMSAMVMVAGVAALAICLTRPDPLTGVRFVEHVLVDGWRSGPLIGAALSLGALAMLAPVFTARTAHPVQQRAIIAFTFTWGLLLYASIIAPYPTPLLGYGASAIIGYFLSILALRPPPARTEELA